MKKILSLILCLTLAMSLAACSIGGESTEPTGFTPVSDGDSIGSGSTTFPLEIVDADGNAIHITVATNKTIVGEALQELGLLEGTEGDYGLYISTVNGIRAVYEESGTYWAFYINGEYAMTGVDQTSIAAGETYKLVVEKG